MIDFEVKETKKKPKETNRIIKTINPLALETKVLVEFSLQDLWKPTETCMLVREVVAYSVHVPVDA